MRNKGILLAIILTASLGRIQYGDHVETWYDLNMSNVCQNATNNGIIGDYWERKDGCKMWGKYVILASHSSVPVGTVIDTSRGLGIVLDRHTTDVNVYDLATTWGRGGKW